MAVLQPLRAIEKVNFPDDRLYTINAIIEELALSERHCRDESYKSCSCIGEKHLHLIAGLASEGYGFAESHEEKEFMRQLQVRARKFKADIKGMKFRSSEDYDGLRAWLREQRHRLDERNWTGEYEKLEVPDSVNRLVEELEALETENPLSLSEIEEDTAWRMVNYLCKKHNVPPPNEIVFTDRCNPILPNAAHIQRDEITHEGITNRSDLDTLVFCQGGLTAYAVAHEMKHYLDHHRGEIVADEVEANKFAIKETRNTLYTAEVDNKQYIKATQNKLTGETGMAIDMTKGLEVGVGLSVAKLVDKYDGWFETQFPGYAQSAKIIAGAGLSYLSLDGRLPEGWIADIALFAGMELLVSELFKLLPVAPAAARAVVVSGPAGPVALPGMPGRAVITAASPYTRMYSTPTRLTAGYPQVAQVDSKWIQVRV